MEFCANFGATLRWVVVACSEITAKECTIANFSGVALGQMTMKAQLFVVIDFNAEHPIPRFLGGIKGRTHQWRITSFKRLHETIKQKRFYPERIFVPFAWYWLAEGEKGRFRPKKAKDHPGVHNTLRKFIRQETEWMRYRKGKNAYTNMPSFMMVFEQKKNQKWRKTGLLQQCFNATPAYINPQDPSVIDSDSIHMLPSDKLEQDNKLNEMSLRALDKQTIDNVKLSNKSKEDRKRIEQVCDYLESNEFTIKMLTLPSKDRKVPPGLRPFLIANCLSKYSSLDPEQRQPVLLSTEDFAPRGYVFRRDEVDKIEEAFNSSNMVVVKGESSSGKSTAIMCVGYDLDKDEDKLVFLIDPRVRIKLPEASDFYPLQGNSLYILIDDAHRKEMANFVEDICDSNTKCKLLIGMRSFSQFSKATTFLDLYQHRSIELTVTDEVKERMISRISQAKSIDKEDIEFMLNNELPSWQDDLLNLAFGLQIIEKEGKLNQDNLIDAIESRVTTTYLGKQTVKHAERVLFPLSIFYQYGVPVARGFIEDLTGIEISTIDELIERGEVIETFRGGFLSIQHSSLAKLYLSYFRKYPDSVEELVLQLRGKHDDWVEGAIRQYLDKLPGETFDIIFTVGENACHICVTRTYDLASLELPITVVEERKFQPGRKLLINLMTDSVIVTRFIYGMQALLYVVGSDDAHSVLSTDQSLRPFLAGFAVALFHCLLQEDMHPLEKRKMLKDNFNLLLKAEPKCEEIYEFALERGIPFIYASHHMPRVGQKTRIPSSLTSKDELTSFLVELDKVLDRPKARQTADEFYHATLQGLPVQFYKSMGIYWLSRLTRILAYANREVAKKFVHQLDLDTILDVMERPPNTDFFGRFLGNLSIIDHTLASCFTVANQKRIERILKEKVEWWDCFVAIIGGLLLANREVTLAVIKNVDFWAQFKKLPFLMSRVYLRIPKFFSIWFSLQRISEQNDQVALELLREFYQREAKIILKSLRERALEFLAKNNVLAIYELSKFVGMFLHYGLIRPEKVLEVVPIEDFYRCLGRKDFATVVKFASQGIPEVLATLPIRASGERILREAYHLAFTFKELTRIRTTWCSPKQGSYSHLAHYLTCGLIRDVSRKALVIYRSREKVFEAGKIPCGVCNCEILFSEFMIW